MSSLVRYISWHPISWEISSLNRSHARYHLSWDLVPLLDHISSDIISLLRSISCQISCKISYLVRDLLSLNRSHLSWDIPQAMLFLVRFISWDPISCKISCRSHLSWDLVLLWDHISSDIISLKINLLWDLMQDLIYCEISLISHEICFMRSHLLCDLFYEILSLIRDLLCAIEILRSQIINIIIYPFNNTFICLSIDLWQYMSRWIPQYW